MRKRQSIALTLILITICLLISGCQSQEARNVDEKIGLLLEEEVSLDIGKDIYKITQLLQGLSEKERGSLRNLAGFEAISAEYMLLEDQAVAEIESLINSLPPVDEIKLASESEINAASRAFRNATEEVQNRVSNKAILEAAKARMEKVKKDSWVECNVCYGKGTVKCHICGGKGSKPATYTTPNGITWDVSQDCPTTEKCSACDGKGGRYVETP